MISPELLRRYPFFSELSHDRLVALADVAEEMTVDAGHIFFHEGEELRTFYIVLAGGVGIVLELPNNSIRHTVSSQLTGELKTRDTVASTIVPGEVFGWSGLVAPHVTTAGAMALTDCRVVSFDCRRLEVIFAEDCKFGYAVMQKIAQVVRQRLRDLRVESLAHTLEAQTETVPSQMG